MAEIVQLLRMVSGVVGPALSSTNVLKLVKDPTFGADTVKLFMVMQPLLALAATVVESMLTVRARKLGAALAALVIKLSDWMLFGGTPSDQLTPFSHLNVDPLVRLVQVSICASAVVETSIEVTSPNMPITAVNRIFIVSFFASDYGTRRTR